MPLLIRAPALATPQGHIGHSGHPQGHIGHGVAVHDLVELVDIMPTVIDLATPSGYPAPPSHLEGTSLVPLMAEALGSTNERVAKRKTVSLTQFPRWG